MVNFLFNLEILKENFYGHRIDCIYFNLCSFGFINDTCTGLFLWGLGRRKNVLNTMMMSLAPMALASILWVIIGFSFSFSGNNSWIGNFDHLFMNGVDMAKNSLFPANHIPDGLFSGFQMMFSIITVALITGSVVGRMRFTPILLFMGAWLILVYYPLAHMVWGGGFLAQIHAIDFAGETLFISLVGLQV